MKYQKHLSKLRHIALHLQGQSLKQVLLRAAAKRAEEIADNVHHSEEIFSALKESIYAHTNELSSDSCYNIAADAECLSELKNELVNKIAEPFEWDETLFGLLEGLPKEDRSFIEQILKNQHNHNLGCAESGCVAYDLSKFRDLMVVMARRIYTNLPVRKLIGMQAMQGPVGLSYFLKYRAKDDEEGEYLDIPTDEELDFSNTGKKITLEVVSQATEARSRKLQASYTLEAMEDLKSMNGVDIEAEMVSALSAEIRDEITYEILHDLRSIAGEPELVKLEGDETLQISKLRVHINHAANEIARNTRRGAGNWIVVPHTIGSILSDVLKDSVFESIESNDIQTLGELREIGTLHGTIKVFSNHAQPTDEILIGYKGVSDSDTGYVNCPYIPLMTKGVVVHPKTFQPLITLMTRYGKVLNGGDWDKDSTTPHIAANYYKLLKIESDLLVPKKE